MAASEFWFILLHPITCAWFFFLRPYYVLDGNFIGIGVNMDHARVAF